MATGWNIEAVEVSVAGAATTDVHVAGAATTGVDV